MGLISQSNSNILGRFPGCSDFLGVIFKTSAINTKHIVARA